MVDQPRLGILMLDTRFPRVLGDVGNAKSFDFPVKYRIVPLATPEAIVLGDSRKWIDAFVAEGQSLVAAGCAGLATTCGFLSLVREEVSKACGVPVASSSLEQVPMLSTLLPKGQRVGVLTISKDTLSPDHLSAARVPLDVPICGVDGTEFANAILKNSPNLDTDTAETELVNAAVHFCETRPEIGAIVLECTNMPPYADAISRATGRPVYSILSYLNWFHDGLPK